MPQTSSSTTPFPETQTYVKRILGTAEDYRYLYGGGLLDRTRTDLVAATNASKGHRDGRAQCVVREEGDAAKKSPAKEAGAPVRRPLTSARCRIACST